MKRRPRWQKRGKRALRFALLAPFLLPLGVLPRPWARRVGALYGRWAARFLNHEAARARRHLDGALPELDPVERARLARDCFVSVGYLAVDFLRIARGGGPALLDGLVVEGVEHLEATERSGRGTLLVTAHFGNWELLAVYLARRPRPLHVLYHPFDETRLDRFVARARQRAGVRLIAADRPGHAYRALARGHLVGVLVDRVPKQGGVADRFFGRECRSAEGMARLALRTGALVLPAALWEDSASTYRARFWPPRDTAPEAGRARGRPADEDVSELARWATARTEEMVRTLPERWPWFYDRWRVRGSR